MSTKPLDRETYIETVATQFALTKKTTAAILGPLLDERDAAIQQAINEEAKHRKWTDDRDLLAKDLAAAREEMARQAATPAPTWCPKLDAGASVTQGACLFRAGHSGPCRSSPAIPARVAPSGGYVVKCPVCTRVGEFRVAEGNVIGNCAQCWLGEGRKVPLVVVPPILDPGDKPTPAPVAPKFGLGPAELAKRVAAETEYWKSHYGKEVERSSSRLRSREATASELAHVVEGLAKSTVARLEAEATAEQLAGALRGLYDAAPEVHQDPRAKWGSVCEAAREALKSHKHGTALAEHDAKVRADERERAFTILHDGIVREKGEASLAEHDAKVVTDAAGAQCERDWNAFGRILVGLNEPIPPPTATALAEHDRKLRSQVLGEVVDWFERNHEPEPAELVRQLRRIHELRTGPIPTTFETEHAEKWLAEHDKALTDRIAKLMDGMELAWGVIANAGGGDWDLERPEWKEAAIRWRDEHWHPAVGVARALTKEPRK